MPMTEYESAYMAHAAADLAFRKEQEAGMMLRHVEHQASLSASADATKQLAAANTALAAAAQAGADAQRYAAQTLAADKLFTAVELAISRMNDRTGTTSTADIPRAVREVIETFNEAARQLASPGSS